MNIEYSSNTAEQAPFDGMNSVIAPRTSDRLSVVLDLHDWGLTVIPLKPRSKIAAVSWKDFQSSKPTLDQVQNWFAEETERNVGILTGASSGIVVLDIDADRGGEESVAKLGPLPRTATVKTGRGTHYYFQHPGFDVPNQADMLPGVDLRGDGGYVVAPPSVHENGSAYKWETGLDEASLAPIPESVLTFVTRRKDGADADCDPTTNTSASTPYGLRALSEECDALSKLPKGARNHDLNIAACKIGQLIGAGELDEAEARAHLIEACERNGLVGDDRLASVHATINSGFKKGKRNPRGPAASEANEQNSRKASAGLTLVKASDIEPRRIWWLWKPVLAIGKLSIIAGDPGVAKSHVAISIAATVSSGGSWPASSQNARTGNVIIISAEDDPADTILPRLLAAGADLEKVYILCAARDDSGGRLFDLNHDVHQLEKQLEAIGGAHLIIIDPITAYLGKADANNNGDVRGILARLAQLAERHNTCILGVSHLNKDAGKKAAYRITGSLGFSAAARTVYLIDKDGGDPNRRIMAPIKNNVSKDNVGFAFAVDSVTLENGIETSHVKFEDTLHTATADEVLIEKSDGGEALQVAKDFLEAMLKDGPLEASEIKREAENVGICERTLHRAKRKLGVDSCRRGKKWYWEVTASSDQPAAIVEQAFDSDDRLEADG